MNAAYVCKYIYDGKDELMKDLILKYNFTSEHVLNNQN